MCRTSPHSRRGFPSLAAFLLVMAAGCGPSLYKVEGKVTLEDGQPMPSGMVSFEMQEGKKLVMARGNIELDGSYRLSTYKPGDGALPGKYRVLVAPAAEFSGDPPEGTPPRVDIDARFKSFDTSGLTFEVKPEKNVFPIKVARPGKKPQ